MAQFQVTLGIVLIVAAVILIALAIYNLVIIGKATTTLNDQNAILTDGERRGGYGVNIIVILIGLVIGVYGFVLLVPEEGFRTETRTIKSTRSVSGAVVTPTGELIP